MGAFINNPRFNTQEWDRKPWTKQDFAKIITELQTMITSPATMVFSYLSFPQCNELKEAVEECGAYWVACGTAIHENKSDPPGRHLANIASPFGVFCLGSHQRAYWYHHPDPLHSLKANVMYHRGHAKVSKKHFFPFRQFE